MGIKDTFEIKEIPNEIAKPFILKKHYAETLPSISYCFGLHKEQDLVGVCTFGMPPNYVENKAWKPFDLLELNRLVSIENLPKNALSYFVSHSLKKLSSPLAVIAYADKGKGHHGYIYQATNWVYTGLAEGTKNRPIYIMKSGQEKHRRHAKDINMDNVKEIKRTEGKHRYYYFVGNKREKRKMRKKLRFEEKPYPKGDNEKHKKNVKVNNQKSLI